MRTTKCGMKNTLCDINDRHSVEKIHGLDYIIIETNKNETLRDNNFKGKGKNKDREGGREESKKERSIRALWQPSIHITGVPQQCVCA